MSPSTRDSGTRSKRRDDHPPYPSAEWTARWISSGWRTPDTAGWTDLFDRREYLSYAGAMKDKFGYVQFVGLPTQGGPDPTSLDRLFVEPAFARERIDPNTPLKNWPQRFALMDAVISNPRLVVLGDPGSGKTTLVNWLVLSLLSRDKNRLQASVGQLIPIVLVLRELALEIRHASNGSGTWNNLLEQYSRSPAGAVLGSAPQIEGYLKAGRAMVMVDGLDEAGGVDARQRIVEGLQHAFKRYPSVRWVLTSRVVGYDEAGVESTDWTHHFRFHDLLESHPQSKSPSDLRVGAASHRRQFDDYRSAEEAARSQSALMGKLREGWMASAKEIAEVAWSQEPMSFAERMYIAPFDDERVNTFVRNWHEQHEPDRTSRSKRATELISAINGSPQVRGLARIPNLLTMIALVYRVYVHLPDGRARLYDRIAQAYLETIDVTRKLPTLGHTLEDMKRWLGYAAFQMQRARFDEAPGTEGDNGILVSRGQLAEWINFAMSLGDPAALAANRPTANAFVDWIARRAGLVIPRSDELFAFTHLSFQEYFAAWFLAEQVQDVAWTTSSAEQLPLSSGTDVESLRMATHDTRWHETFVLMFEVLEGRGRWSSIAFKALVSSSERADDTLPKNRTPFELASQGVLFVLLARDRHSGLSPELRSAAFHRAWTALGNESDYKKRMEHIFPYSSGLGERLLEPDFGQPSPALAALSTFAVPPQLTCLVLPPLTSDDLIIALSSARKAMENLTCLCVAGTLLTDAAVKEISREDTAFKSLITLDLSSTRVTDGGVSELARAFTGLKSLSVLRLGSTPVSDWAVKVLAREASGLKLLSVLDLSLTGLTDLGVIELCRKDTSLGMLTSLDLGGTAATDVGLRELARKETGVKMLSTLRLTSTRVTDDGAKCLANRQSGLRELTSLTLMNTRITDSALQSFGQSNSGLTMLSYLDLEGTDISDEGLRALSHSGTGLSALSHLDVANTKVTNAGVKALISENTGLKSLSFLRTTSTKVTDAGLREFKRVSPQVRVI